MTSPDPELGKFGITARLFRLVNAMPKDQQLILLKQLVGNDVSNQLYKLIVEMTEEQQIILLEHMGRQPEIELPVHTINLEETGASMREDPRKPCLINASYRIQDRNYQSYILDISIGGVFIETDERVPLGRQMLLKFSLPNQKQPFSFAGKIAWSGPKGFGVRFDKISPLQMQALRSFIEQND